ncbi:MAG: hypothetical protein U5R49_20130 [Deltaproteobacteria bacterium]|nr:hypothetical protein [Deltaproteobacteria bacterium]
MERFSLIAGNADTLIVLKGPTISKDEQTLRQMPGRPLILA